LERQYRKTGLTAPGVQERVIRLYDAEITATDEAIGQLLDELRRRGLLDNTIIVVTSDHGEGFREHSTTEHGWNLFPEVYEVPLVIVWTGQLPAGKRVRRQVQSIDVAPTLMELAGLPVPRSFEGRSLLPFEAAEREDRIAVCAVGLNDYVPNLDYIAVVSPDHLYIRERRHNTVELYDLRSDPGAQNDLGAEHPVAASYASLVSDGSTTVSGGSGKTVLDELTRSQLQALGYLDD
jgi:arylsulfatase A-like enzyme